MPHRTGIVKDINSEGVSVSPPCQLSVIWIIPKFSATAMLAEGFWLLKATHHEFARLGNTGIMELPYFSCETYKKSRKHEERLAEFGKNG